MSALTSNRSLLDHFSALREPRQSWRVFYPLPENLLLVLCAPPCRAWRISLKSASGASNALIFSGAFFPSNAACRHTTRSMTSSTRSTPSCSRRFSPTGSVAAPSRSRRHRHRRQDFSANPCTRQGTRAAARGLRLGGASAPRPGPRSRRSEVQRDRRHSFACSKGSSWPGARHHRRHGNSDRYRATDRRRRRRLSPGAQSQSARSASRRRRFLRQSARSHA